MADRRETVKLYQRGEAAHVVAGIVGGHGRPGAAAVSAGARRVHQVACTLIVIAEGGIAADLGQGSVVLQIEEQAAVQVGYLGPASSSRGLGAVAEPRRNIALPVVVIADRRVAVNHSERCIV